MSSFSIRMAFVASLCATLLAGALERRAATQQVAWLWDDARAPAWSIKEVAVVTTHYLLRDDQLLVRPRMHAPDIPPSTQVTPVVHVEISTVRPPIELARHRQALVDAILDAAEGSTSGTVQLDMEARPSQRVFYLSIVKEMRAKLPPNKRLSVTALAWWCRSPAWMDEIAADEVVPMFFRMGRDKDEMRRIVQTSPDRMHPRCRAGAAGFSAQEAVDASVSDRYAKVYWFDNFRWRRDERHLQSEAP